MDNGVPTAANPKPAGVSDPGRPHAGGCVSLLRDRVYTSDHRRPTYISGAPQDMDSVRTHLDVFGRCLTQQTKSHCRMVFLQ
jgi:hypothetical protein